MADSVIGALRVVLGMDTAAFTQGAKEAQSTLDSLAKTFKGALAGLGVGLGLNEFVKSIQHAVDAADQLGKSSQKFGVPVEQLSALKYAADLADVSFESLGKGLGKLSKAMLDSAANPAGQAAKTFQALGITVTDTGGHLKDTQEIFGAVASKFANMEDGATKTALAIRVFGKAGAELIPLLNEGRDGLKHLTDEAASFGIVIGQDAADKAQLFNDNMKRIHSIMDAVFIKISGDLLPALIALQREFLNTAKETGTTESVFKKISETIQTDIQDFRALVLVLGFAGDALKQLFTIATSGFDVGAIGQAAARLTEIPKQMGMALDNLRSQFDKSLPVDAFGSHMDVMAAKAKKGFGDINMGALAATNALDNFIKSQQKSIAQQQADAATVGAAVGVHEAMRVTMEGEAIAVANNIKMTDAQRVALKNLSDQAGATAVALAGAKLTQEFLSPWDQYLQKVRDVNIMLQQNAISADVARQASAKAASSLVDVYGNAAATTAGNFASAFSAIAGNNKSLFEAAKAFSIAEALINVFVGVTKAIAQGGPLGIITGAGVLAAGMATVAKIIATKPPGMALGGSMQLGGAGGTDTKMIPIMATPGERVHVEQNKYGDEGAGNTFTIQGLKAKEYYRGDVLRDLVDNLNQAMRDGLKLKLA